MVCLYIRRNILFKNIKEQIIKMYQVYVRNTNGGIVILQGNRYSFRCRQRDNKVKSMKFISFREVERCRKLDTKVYGPMRYNTISRL